MRKKIVAGNWKMNKTNSEAVKTVTELKEIVNGLNGAEIVVATPFTAISDVVKAVAGTNIKVAAQNMHWEEKGAFTGEIAPCMLKELGVEYVILGHSERREYFGETNEIVNKKVKAAIKNGITPILCVGEKLADREAGNTENVVKDHTVGGMKDLTKEEAAKVVIAYEPVWAIGTGKNASPEQAEEVHFFIRNLLTEMYDADTAAKIVVQYGGSMNAANSKDLLAKPNIDGGLIGGASLVPADFSVIVKNAQ